MIFLPVTQACYAQALLLLHTVEVANQIDLQ